jgi:WD40 repeat protein
MLRWFVVTATLSVAAVVVGVLAAGLPAVERVQDAVSPATVFGNQAQAPQRQVLHDLVADRRLLMADMGNDFVDGHLPVGVVPRVVVNNCHLTPYDVQEVPSEHDGKILFLGTALLPDEPVDPEDRIQVEVGTLVIEMKQGEVAPKDQVFQVPGRPAKPAYRPYKNLDPIEPNKLALVPQTQVFRRLKPGTVVKEGQLLGMINPDLALDDLGVAIAELDASDAKHRASTKTKEEAMSRLDRAEILFTKGSIPKEELDGARLTVERYRFEEIENFNGIVSARKKLGRAYTTLKQHEIRASISGVVNSLYKHTKGEAVKGLEKGADTVVVLQNVAKLKVDGKVDIQSAQNLHADMEVVVEPIYRENHSLAFRGHLHEISGVAVSKNNLIVSAAGEQRVYIWDPSLVNRPKAVLVHQRKAFAVACTPLANAEHNYCLTGAEDGIGRIWDLKALEFEDKERLTPLRELRDGHSKPINCVAFSPKGKWCATGSDDNTICIWDAATGRRLDTLTGHRGRITCVQFASENQLVSAAADHMLVVWSLNGDGTADKTRKLEDRGGDVAVLGVHPNGKQVLFDKGKELRILSLPDLQYTGFLQNDSGAMTFTTMALFSTDGKLILTNGATEGRLQVWRAPTPTTRGYELSQLIWKEPATCGAFAPDGSFVVTGSKDSYILVWPLPAKEMIEKQLKAKIIAVDNSLEDSSGVLVHAEMTNPNNLLYAGDKATLVVYPGTR